MIYKKNSQYLAWNILDQLETRFHVSIQSYQLKLDLPAGWILIDIDKLTAVS